MRWGGKKFLPPQMVVSALVWIAADVLLQVDPGSPGGGIQLLQHRGRGLAGDRVLVVEQQPD